ncbi:hypothetical protein GW17_00001562 [Ensete ventricosum]|nr:hypothetical protein GW17_00001562 [Ensete ventricosum]RZS10857.1 hypothetical protein BHM03_00042135 [Ensete ventricosum]
MPSTAWARPNKDGPGGYIGRVGDEEPAFCHLLRPSDEATTSPEVEGGRGLNVGRIAWAPHESAEGFGRFALFRGNSGHSVCHQSFLFFIRLSLLSRTALGAFGSFGSSAITIPEEK